MENRINGTNITSLAEYLTAIKSLRQPCGESGWYYQWYRGHGDKNWDLIPKVQRGFDTSRGTEELFRKERYLTNDFQAKASVFSPKRLAIDDFPGWLTLMRHYGLSTRLLDWSKSPLIALYFAVSDVSQCDKDACVWVLNPYFLNKQEHLEKPTKTEDGEYDNTYLYNMEHRTIYTMIYSAFRRWEFSSDESVITPEDRKFDHRFNELKNKIAACYPVEADGRVYNQFAAFTVHNTLQRLTDICDESTLRRIIIPHESKGMIKDELAVCGITESFIYPDLEHLAIDLDRHSF